MSCALPDLDLTLPVGTSPSWPVTIVDPESGSTPVDITAATAVFTVKATPYDDNDDAIFQLTTGDSEILIIDAAAGQMQIDNTVSKSELLTAGRWYFWYFVVTLGSGEIRLSRKGRLYAEGGAI